MNEAVTVNINLDNLKLMYLSMRDCANRLDSGNMTIDYWIKYLEENYQAIRETKENIEEPK